MLPQTLASLLLSLDLLAVYGRSSTILTRTVQLECHAHFGIDLSPLFQSYIVWSYRHHFSLFISLTRWCPPVRLTTFHICRISTVQSICTHAVGPSATQQNFLQWWTCSIYISNMAATSHKWVTGASNEARVTKETFISFVSIKVHCICVCVCMLKSSFQIAIYDQ